MCNTQRSFPALLLQLIRGCHGNQLETHQRCLSHRREPVEANYNALPSVSHFLSRAKGGNYKPIYQLINGWNVLLTPGQTVIIALSTFGKFREAPYQRWRRRLWASQLPVAFEISYSCSYSRERNHGRLEVLSGESCLLWDETLEEISARWETVERDDWYGHKESEIVPVLTDSTACSHSSGLN